MDQTGTEPIKPARRHLRAAGEVSSAGDRGRDADLTRHRGQGNGVRIHGVLFTAASVFAVVLVVLAFILVSRMM